MFIKTGDHFTISTNVAVARLGLVNARDGLLTLYEARLRFGSLASVASGPAVCAVL